MQASQELYSHAQGRLSASSQSMETRKTDDLSVNELVDLLGSSTPANKVFACLPRGVFTPAAVEYLVESIGLLPIDTELRHCLLQRQLNLGGVALTIYDHPGGYQTKEGWAVLQLTIKRISQDLCRLTYHLEDEQVITTDFEALSLD